MGPIPTAATLNLPSAESDGASALLDALRGAFEDGQAALQRGIAAGVQAVDLEVQAAQGQVSAAEGAAVAQTSSAFATATATVQGAMDLHVGSVQSAGQAGLAQVAAGQATASAEATATAAQHASSAEQIGQASVAEGAQAEETLRGGAQSAVMSAVGEAQGQGAGSGGGSTPEAAAARAAAAQELATDTANSMEGKIGEINTNIADAGGTLKQGLTSQASSVASAFLQQAPTMIASVASIAAGASSALVNAAAQGATSLRQSGQQVLGALGGAESSAVAAIHDQGQRAREALAASAAEAGAALQQQGDEALAESASSLSEVGGELAGVDCSAADAQEMTGGLETEILGSYETAGDSASQGAEVASQALRAEGASAAGQLGDSASAAAGGASAQASEGADAMASSGATLIGQLATIPAQATQSATGLVQDASGAMDQQLADLDAGLSGGVASWQQSLQPSVDSMVSDTKKPLSTLAGRIGTAESKAEDKVQKSWLEEQLSDLWDMVTSPGFIAGLIAGLVVLGAIVLIIGTGGLAALSLPALMAVGAAVGGTGAFVGTVAQNYADGARGMDVFNGAGVNLLIGAGVGALMPILPGPFWATAVGAGVANTGAGIVINKLTGQPLDKNLIANFVTGTLLALVFKGLLGLRGRPAAKTSEIQVGKALKGTGTGSKSQQSFKGRGKVNYGTKGSTRPDEYVPGKNNEPGTSYEVKNYDVTTPKGVKALIRDVVNQATSRDLNLPLGTTQKIVVDVTGQNVTPSVIEQIRTGIVNESGGIIKTGDVHISVDGDQLVITWAVTAGTTGASGEEGDE